MQIVRSFDELRARRLQTAVTVGNFDGVHLAHREIIACVRSDAAARGCVSAALTFEPHPIRILHPESAPRLITPAPEKIRQFESTGIELLVLLPFNRDLSLLTPLEFAEKVLVQGLGSRAVHEGANFHFGRRQAGDIHTLQRLGREFGFAVHVHPEMKIGGDVVSSTRIRELVAAGGMNRARKLLGRCFAVKGEIAHGRGLGRRLTVPTLNLQHYEELLPANGVYITQTLLAGQIFDSVTNVGVRPTLPSPAGESAAPHVTVESHLLDFREVEAEEMEIRFLLRLRDEKKFASPVALRAQILRDIERTRSYFRRTSKLRASR
jgi:riboflavin kinase/FMN adenylyltransferase